MATTKSLGQKDKNDKFYTKSKVAKQCIDLLNLQYDFIIEPSAGNGSFSKQIKDCIALDLEPADSSIKQQDFFKFNYNELNGKILVIGNPPFGQQSKLAIEFFNYAARFATTIAFILPKSFRKPTIQNRLDLNFELVKELELPKNSFTFEGKDYDVGCVFQVWKKTNIPRKKVKLKTTSKYFEFTKDITKADFRVQRVGGNAGKAFEDLNGAQSSNYFIINKTELLNQEVINFINDLEYDTITDTVGPKSLSKGEFVKVFEENWNKKIWKYIKF